MSEKNIKVSIIIPAYNVEKYIGKGIKSCCDQTYRNIEIIIVDDGSTDDTGHIIEMYSRKDPRIIPFHQVNQGVSVARNLGIENAKGEYVLFLDSDDWLERNAVEILVSNVKDKETLICCDCYFVYIDNNSVGVIRKDQTKDTVIETCSSNDAIQYIGISSKYRFVSSCYKLFNKEILDSNNLRFIPGIHQGEDGLFSYKYLCNIDNVKYIPAPLWNILDRPGSACNGGYSIKWKTALDAIDLMIAYREKIPPKTKEQLLAFKAERAMWLELNCTTSTDYKHEDFRAYQRVLKNNRKYLIRREKNVKTVAQCMLYPCLPAFIMRKYAKYKMHKGK